MKEQTLNMILSRLEFAREKFPQFAPSGRFEAVCLVGEEFGEFAQAVNDDRMIDAVDEALDTITTCVRFIEEAMNEQAGEAL